MRTNSDLCIIGAGAVGCSIAYYAALKGLKVLVLDPSGIGQEASSAAAGILSALDESEQAYPTLNARLQSLGLFPDLVRRLKLESGIDACYRRVGRIILEKPQKARELHPLFKMAETLRLPLEKLDEGDIRKLEPELCLFPWIGAYNPKAYLIRANLFTQAIALSAQKRGARFLRKKALGFIAERGRVLACKIPQGCIFAGAYVLCSGAWTGKIARALGWNMPIFPARGQLLHLTAPSRQMLRHILEYGKNYLIPWPEKIVVGTTVERVGFRRGTTREATNRLFQLACELLPALTQAQTIAKTYGFRPQTADGLPIIGKCHWDNLWIAAGHFRQGILLSPWTGKKMSGWIYKNQEPTGMEAFSPARFNNSVTDSMQAAASAPWAKTRS